MSNNDAKLNYVESIIRGVVENDNFQISDSEGEKFIREYLELTRTMEFDPVTRMRFVIICLNEIPTLVFKSRGLITADEFNREIDLYVDSLDQQTKVEFIRMLLKDGDGAVYSRDSAEMMDNFSKSINDTNTNWHAICEHIEGIGEKLGLVQASEATTTQSTQQFGNQSNSQSYGGSSSGSYSQSTKSGGCYVATAVYGSYDCPQVWTLRRYRDFELAEHWYGRAFIQLYYAISPTIVKWFGGAGWFNKIWRKKLDAMVSDLQKKGYSASPYTDKNW